MDSGEIKESLHCFQRIADKEMAALLLKACHMEKPHGESTCMYTLNLPNIMPMATKVHVISRRYAMLTWMHDNRDLVQHVILWNSTMSTLHMENPHACMFSVHPKPP
jgi:hypothetical protein